MDFFSFYPPDELCDQSTIEPAKLIAVVSSSVPEAGGALPV